MVPGCSLSQQLEEIFRVTQTLHCLLANLRLELAALVTVPNKILPMKNGLDSILAFGFLGSIDFKSRDQNTPLKIKNAWVLPRLLFASSKERQCNRDWYFLSPSHKPSLPKRNQVQTQSTEQPFGLEMPDATTCTKPNKTLRPTEKMFSTLLTFQKVVDRSVII